MEKRKAQNIMSRFSQLEQIRADYEPLWSDITDLVAPRRSDLTGLQTPGKKQGLKIYDGTPRTACQQHADGLFGYLCSPTTNWFLWKIAKKEIAKLPEIKKYLQDGAEQMYYAFNRSNFYAVTPEYFFDGCSIGTATMYAEEDSASGRIVFIPRHPREIYISANQFGDVDVLFRKFKLTARNAVAKFKTGLSAKIISAATKNTESEFDFIHAVFPNTDRQLGKLNSKNMVFSSIYIEFGGSKVLSESGYNFFPYSVWRYRINSGEVYGRSPAGDAIVEILGLNQITKTILQASQLAVEPAYNVPKEMRGKVRIQPRGLNYFDEDKRIITPINVPVNLPAGETQQERMKKSIEANFHTDFFTLLSRAAMEGRQLSVPQVVEMQGEKGAMLGAVVGRLNGDFFDGTINRVFNIETAAGRMPDIPDILYEYDDMIIETEYLGLLAQAQKQQIRLNSITRSMEIIMPLMEIDPNIRDRINFDEMVDEILDTTGFPVDAIIPVDQAEKVRVIRAEQETKQRELQMMSEAADKVPGLGKPVDESSVLAQMTGE